MRKFLIALALLTILPVGFTANAEKKDQKEKDQKEQDKHQPAKIGVFEWEYAWSPVFRAMPTDEETKFVILESECE